MVGPEHGADLFGGRAGPTVPAPAAAIDHDEIENRALRVTNVDPGTTRDELLSVFGPSQNVRGLDVSGLDRGIVVVDYFDFREAQDMRRSRNGATVHGGAVSVGYAPLAAIKDPKRPPNNGTIVVFHLPEMSPQEIEGVFRKFGEIRQVRGTPAKLTQRFVEFWDVRAAEQALNSLNGQFVMKSRISIEFSLPGGFRRNGPRCEHGAPGRSPYG